jgi:hypothetical protein
MQMAERSHIAAVGPETTPPGPEAEPLAQTEEVLPLEEDWLEEETPSRRRFGWVAPALAVLVIVGWTGFFGYAHQNAMLAGAAPQQWIDWTTSWAVPVLLVVAVWLLAMRSSSREAARFGDAAKLLSEESARLERRLTTVNRELSLAREFIAAQSRDLDALGRIATERLSTNADKLQGLIRDNGAQIDSIATVSAIALENMDKLRGDLPVVANSARDVTSQIGNAGRTAHGQLEELISGFHRLNEFGEASERQVQSLRVKIDAALAAFEAQAANLDKIAGARFEALDQRSLEFRADLDRREVEALASIRRRAEALAEELATSWTDFDSHEAGALAALRERLEGLRSESEAFAGELRGNEDAAAEKWGTAIGALRDQLVEALQQVAEIDGAALERTRKRLVALNEEARHMDAGMQRRVEEFLQSVEARRVAHEAEAVQATAALEQRFAEVDEAIAKRHQDHVAHVSGLTRRSEVLAERLTELAAEVETLSAQGAEAGDGFAKVIAQLSGNLEANRATLEATDDSIARLTDASVRLLELIQAGASHSRELLPEAIAVAEQSLSGVEDRAREVSVLLGDASEKGQALSNYVVSAGREGKEAMENLEKLHLRLIGQQDEQAQRVESLRASLAGLVKESEELSERARGELTEAIERLENALRNALEELGSSDTVENIAVKIGEQGAEAIDRAIRQRTTEAIGELEQAASHASGVSREAARQLRDQLSKVDELAGTLENRVQRARERAEERVDNDFARRAALITDSLNSNAIDLAKALSNDVTDTAWAAYLRGDRGIFTRRAVRLLDNSEAREIAEIYDRDHDFREHVNRYIHDFEGMLRTMLSTRDGNALGVTLLSSDMGKLYVALAQAIERLRTSD